MIVDRSFSFRFKNSQMFSFRSKICASHLNGLFYLTIVIYIYQENLYLAYFEEDT